MKFSSLKKVEKGITIALTCMILISIAFIAAWKLSLNSINNDEVEEVSTFSQKEKNTAQTGLAKKLDFLPQKCTLNQQLPDLSFENENGDDISLKSMRGKVVVLSYWASWCPYCQKELGQAAEIKEMLSEYSDDVEFILINKLDGKKETKEQALSYIKQNKIPFNTLFDENLKVYKQLGLKVIPTTLVIDKQGYLRAWYADDNLNASVLKAKIDYTFNGGADGVYNFIAQKLINEDGGIRTNYVQEKDSKQKNTNVLSESQGLMLEYAVGTGNKELFDRTLDYVINKMRKDPLTAWVVTEDGPSRVNSSLDDLRIYHAMAKADAVWGGYSDKLDNYEQALRHYNTKDQKLVNEYDFKYSNKSNKLKLCFADFKALELLSNKTAQWKEVYQNSISIVENGYISNEFPVYYAEYDYSKEAYKHEDINMAEGMVTLLHLASINRLKPETVNWLKQAIDGDGIFAKYTTDGSVVSGYRYESTAIYGLASMIGQAIGDDNLANRALARMEAMRIFDSSNDLNGAFGNIDGTGIYSFDQLIALITYSNLEK
jgi:peroxiredoxin/endo-1,4-beta-D-glucanase Y